MFVRHRERRPVHCVSTDDDDDLIIQYRKIFVKMIIIFNKKKIIKNRFDSRLNWISFLFSSGCIIQN